MDSHGKRRVIIILVQNKYIEEAFSKQDSARWNSMSLFGILQQMENGSLPLVIRDGYIWGQEMDREELDAAEKNARSFPGLSPPDNARYIGRRCHKINTLITPHTVTYLYWRCSNGKYYYDTIGGMKFKREMEAAQKRRKK